MPPWLLMLIVMVAVILGINPTRKDFAWFQQLRRPPWLPFPSWIPLIRLSIYLCLYISALLTWHARRDGSLIGAYLGLLVLVEGYTWLMCRSRQLATGTLLCLVGWGFALLLAFHLFSVSELAVVFLLPYLVSAPIEALVTWQMRGLNGR